MVFKFLNARYFGAHHKMLRRPYRKYIAKYFDIVAAKRNKSLYA